MNQERVINENQYEIKREDELSERQIYFINTLACSPSNPMIGCENQISKFQAFLAMVPLLKGKLYWKTLSDAYLHSYGDDLIYYYVDVKKAFEKNEIQRENFMTKKEQLFLNSLQQTITIFRGMPLSERISGNYNISWSLDKAIAEKFALAHDKARPAKDPAVVLELQINKSEVKAYFESRAESEIIYIHRNSEC